MEQEVTTDWGSKNYEFEYTRVYFSVLHDLKVAQQIPVADYVKNAFSSVKALAFSLVYSPKHNEEFGNKIKPVLEDMEVILFGDYGKVETRNTAARYKVSMQANNKTKTKDFVNIQNILKELWEIFYYVKQWAYEEGFFAKKPGERRYGKEAVESVMEY